MEMADELSLIYDLSSVTMGPDRSLCSEIQVRADRNVVVPVREKYV